MSLSIEGIFKRTIATPNKKRKKVKRTISAPPFATNSQSGEVLVTGGGDFGQLGLGSEVLEKLQPTLVQLKEEIIDIIAGGMHTVLLTKDGKVITFGCNDEGALGRNTTDDEGEDAEFEPAEVELPEKAIQISAGDSHTAALLRNGKVYAWGTFRDSNGNMGLTMNGNERLPYEMLPNETVVKISSGADHLVMLTENGSIFTCGCAEQGQLGRVAERMSARIFEKNGMDRFLKPTPITTKISFKGVFENVWAGTYCTFAKVHTTNDIFVFGLNNFNQIGIKSTRSQFLPVRSKELSKQNWKQICGAPHHTILLNEDGKVFVIGRKEYGRLGLGQDCEDATELQQVLSLENECCVYVGCGTASSFAVTDKGHLYSWGLGNSGQLGTGFEDDAEIPTLIKNKEIKARVVSKISSGGQHTVILAKESDQPDEVPIVQPVQRIDSLINLSKKAITKYFLS